MAENKERLFSDFPPTTKDEWMEKITADLKGVPFEKKLVWRTSEGINVQPFYRLEDLKDLKAVNALPGEFPYLRGNKKGDNNWLVRQDMKVDCPEKANEKALDILSRGVDALGFCLGKSELSAEFIQTLLKGIQADCVELNFTVCPCKAACLAELLVAYFTREGYDLSKLQGSITFDYIGKMLIAGKRTEEAQAKAAALVKAAEALPLYRTVGVRASALSDAGAFIYQELGYALAWGHEYLTALQEAGIEAWKAARSIKFNFGISSNYFMEIAKFRAARLLWANIVSQYTDCKEAAKMCAHATTSRFNQTVFDAHMNLLRSQTEAMSAALGGVDSMTVVPFDAAYQIPDDFSERLARNQQLLLKEESHFGQVVDPAGGSYYIESLTAAIAQQAWKLFLEVEEAGGFLKAVEDGKVQEAVNASNAARHTNVARRKEVLVGTNQYPNFNECSEGKRPQACGCCCRTEAPELPTLRFDRAASEFEALRLETEQSGKRPVAFMLTIGNLAMRQARAQFSCNFLACAGYKVVDNLGFETVEAGIEAAMEAKADIVVLCSSDDEYATYAPAAFQALNGRALFIVAGAPSCMEDLKAQGIENFIHVRCNVLETLKEYNAKLLK